MRVDQMTPAQLTEDLREFIELEAVEMNWNRETTEHMLKILEQHYAKKGQ